MAEADDRRAAGWVPLGTNVDTGAPLEFSEAGEDGLPDWERRTDGRCGRCGNWPTLCGHHLSFKERAKSVATNYIGWSETR